MFSCQLLFAHVGYGLRVHFSFLLNDTWNAWEFTHFYEIFSLWLLLAGWAKTNLLILVSSSLSHSSEY